MPERAAWFRRCHCSDASEAEIRSSLTGAGVRLQEAVEGPCGIVCFEKVNDEVLSLLHSARREANSRVVAITTEQSESQNSFAWRLLHAGASDVIAWDRNRSPASWVRARIDRWSELDELTATLTRRESLIGNSPAWSTTVRNVVEAARFSGAPILLTGESGTGKELLARLISLVDPVEAGNPLKRELVTVDCGALVPELSGSEFFGHERGAFTSAVTQREGAFATANGRTLLLDEIGEVPFHLQAQLLRAIQEKTYKRVGGNTWQTTNFRLVCATNRNLIRMVHEGQFRLDLYHRIAGCVVRVPSLRERKADILPLATHFLQRIFSDSTPGFDPPVAEYLLNRPYEGNVRELRQLIERIATRHARKGPITVGDIAEEDRPPDGVLLRSWPDDSLEQSIANAVITGVSLKEITQTTAETAIRIAVQSEQGNLQRAASRLGITDRALQMRRASGRLQPGSGGAG
ncbi:MAG TPA: sigma 54-interacting transcriptional regulator [Bryobacteraceae bacterium]|nr:sigma 54-interacting transcriptional regulator [Bryobacteraceae bacterium]